MRVVTDSRLGWSGQSINGQTGGQPNPARCTQLGPGPPAVWGVGNFSFVAYPGKDYFSGISIDIPGAGSEQLLLFTNGATKNVNGTTYYATTKSNWLINCAPVLQNGTGEGFRVKTTDGTEYRFDWIASRPTSSIVDDSCGSAADVLPSTEGLGIQERFACTRSQAVPRDEVFLYATLATDRFGNTVTYTYDPAYPEHLIRIASSDGAEISLNYSGGAHVTSISAAGRTWNYAYSNTHFLQAVTLPDGSAWSYTYGNNITGVTTYNAKEVWANCHVAIGSKTTSVTTPGAGESNTITVTHPSGAVGVFDFRKILHGTREAEPTCSMGTTGHHGGSYYFPMILYPSDYQTAALYRKTISGPGLPAMQWKYRYVPSWTAPYQSETFVTDSANITNYYRYGNSSTNYGQLLEESVTSSAGTATSALYEYLPSAANQVFPDQVGDQQSVRGLEYGAGNWRLNRPLQRKTIFQQGVSFATAVNQGCGPAGTYCYDVYARATNSTASSSYADPTLNRSKSEATAYYDNQNAWVLGQVASVTCLASVPTSSACDGDVVSATTFDATYGLPLTTSIFGKLDSVLGHDTSSPVASGQRGTLQTVTDGNGNPTSLTQWKRGTAQRIDFPTTGTFPATSISAVVDDSGLITSATDEMHNKTCYAYDLGGRLSGITYPSESVTDTCDATAWTPWARTFAPLSGGEYGIGAGNWRETISTGNGFRVAYYDAFWRPLLVHQYDAGNVAASESFVKTSYNSRGLVDFTSYPSASSTPTTGTWTSYDPLSRVISTSQDSENGLLSTTVTYDAGLKTTVTNPRGKVTTTSFMAYDEPSGDAPLIVNLPDGVTTVIDRDPHGKPKSITRSGVYGGTTLSLARSYVYDAYQRLCVTNNPESGATVVDYDNANNVILSVDGMPLTATCDRTAASTAANRLNFSYDPKNRLIARTTVGGVANVETGYADDGKVTQLVSHHASADTVTNTYTYNRRRLLSRETVQVNANGAWGFDYAYNANGHLASQTYPGALVVGYAPDALGRPTQVGTFASGVTYYPTGAISGFTYGNGIVHTMTPNARQLPAHSLDAYGATKFLDDTYAYDANGNVLSMADAAGTDINDRTWGVAATTLYDGLDRLLSARGTNWGTLTGSYNALYTYDPLDNIRSAKVGLSGYTHNYDVGSGTGNTNRLLSMQYNGGAPSAIVTDPAGNITSDARTNHGYQFDVAHRLSAVTGTGAESYLYDGNGRRARTLNSTTGTIEYFGYGADGRLLQDWSSRRGNRKGYVYLGNSLVATYGVTTVNPNLGAITIEYKHTDALGSPVVTTDSMRNISGRQLYTPYGVPLAPVDGVGYTGHYNDVGTGLTYMQQRYYDPQVGRFLSVDPAGVDRASGFNFNRYWYAGDNPYRFTDPDGRCFWDGCVVETIVVVAAGTAILAGGLYVSKQLSDAIGQATGVLPSDRTTQEARTLGPGPYAGDSIPARGPGRDFTPGERDKINEIGRDTGCHTCGTTDPGTKSGNFVPDHQPPNGTNTDGTPQDLLPHCLPCSRTRGGEVRQQEPPPPKTEPKPKPELKPEPST